MATAQCNEESKQPVQVPDLPQELFSCSDLSSGALSDEIDSISSLGGGCIELNSPGASGNCCTTSPRIQLPPYYMGCLTKIEEELQVVMATFPVGTPSSVLCHALGYILQTKWNWQVKFCCQSKDARLPHTMPLSWVEDVMVVMPAERMHCIIDLNFRDKFVVRCPGSLGEKYLSDVVEYIPEVYIGSLNQLFTIIGTWTAAIEHVFRDSSLTLPPWRTRRSFQQLYKFCLECDATESSSCLRHIGSQLSLREDVCMGCEEDSGCSAYWVNSQYVEYIREALKASQCAGAVVFNLSDLCKSEPIDYDFEKEESPVVSLGTDQSGLSYLLNSR